jgi:hypothetical protein
MFQLATKTDLLRASTASGEDLVEHFIEDDDQVESSQFNCLRKKPQTNTCSFQNYHYYGVRANQSQEIRFSRSFEWVGRGGGPQLAF